jgi:hypothetical protein
MKSIELESLGWDLPMQAVGIDTRWGVPRYAIIPVRKQKNYLGKTIKF